MCGGERVRERLYGSVRARERVWERECGRARGRVFERECVGEIVRVWERERGKERESEYV